MTRKNKLFFAIFTVFGLIGELILLGYLATAQAMESADGANSDLAEVLLPRRFLKLVLLVPLTSQGQIVGVVAVYDDPLTPRTEDYLELSDGDGEVVAIGWFDQFGIRRMTVDRGLVEGLDRFQHIFVTLVG